MAHMQTFVISYLRGRRMASVEQIAHAIGQEYPACRQAVRSALYRMAREGMISRTSRGVYTLARHTDMLSSDRLIVAGALDRLESQFGTALVDELTRRGWVR